MLGTSLNHGFVSSSCGPFVTRAFDCVASPMLLGKWIMATPGHVKDGLANHCSLQPPNAYVLATFMLLLCILGACFATLSRWMIMCSLPVGIAACLKAMHDINLGSNFGAARPASQPQDMMIRHGATKPDGSPLPKDVFGSCKEALNELRGSSPIPLLGVSEATWSSTRQ